MSVVNSTNSKFGSLKDLPRARARPAEHLREDIRHSRELRHRSETIAELPTYVRKDLFRAD